MRKFVFGFSLLLYCLFFCVLQINAQHHVSSLNLNKLYSSEFEQRLLENYPLGEEKKNLLPYFLGAESSVTYAQAKKIEEDFTRFTNDLRLQQQRYRSDTRFLYKMFREVHKKYFKTFSAYEPLGKVFSDGLYNCASAASLYALILESLGYSYKIKLTPVHCYLIVHGKERDVLLETTDVQSGFVIGNIEIQERQDLYRSDALRAMQETLVPGNFTNLIIDVSLANMCGLQYYNAAVKHYNASRMEAAVYELSKAHVFYPADRVEALMEVCLDGLASKNELSQKEHNMIKLVKLYISMARD
jgi:hypothetical protein